MIGLGSQTQLGIGIAISLEDRFSNAADRVENRLRKLRNYSRSAVKSAVTDYRNRATAIAGTAAAVTYGFYRMAQSASEFGHKINQIDILGDGKLGKTKKQLGDLAISMSNEFGISSKEIASSMVENVRAGVTKGLDEITKIQLQASIAAGESINTVSSVLLGAASSYDIPIQNIKEFSKVANVLTGVANSTQAQIYSLGEGFEYAGFAAKNMNIPFAMTAAMLGRMEQNGIKGSAAGTQVSNAIQFLGTSLSQWATPKQQAMWGATGLDPKKLRSLVEMGKMDEVILALDKALKDMPNLDRVTLLRNLANMRGSRGIMGIWGGQNTNKTLGELYQQANDAVAKNVISSQSKKMMDDPYMQGKKAIEAFNNALIKFVGKSGPMLMMIAKGLEAFGNVLGVIADTPIGSVLGAIIGVGAPLVAIFWGMRAAALAATQALTWMTGMGKSGGFGELLQAGMGVNMRTRAASVAGGAFAKNKAGNWYAKQAVNIGGKSFKPGQVLPRNFNPSQGGFSLGPYAALNRNAAGRWAVGAGQTFNLGGKLYKGGQILPTGFSPRTVGALSASRAMSMGNLAGGISMATGAFGGPGMASAATRMGVGMAGRLLPILGRIAGFVNPIVGIGLTAWSIYELLKGDSDSEKEARKNDPEYQAYLGRTRQELQDYMNPLYAMALKGLPLMNIPVPEEKPVLNQQIILNVDGTTTLNQAMKQYEDTFEKNLKFNISY